MEPMYVNMMPHPYQNQRDHHMDYRPNYYPRHDVVQPLMYMNPPFNNNHYCSWGSGYNYPLVASCHGCCNNHSHNAWRPTYSHIPPPAYYPPFPTQYVPPPHYDMEHPTSASAYNYASRDQHCCGCPNHRCNQKEQRGVKIQEDPEREEINKNAHNSPYPIVWFPTEHGDNKEHQMDSKHISAEPKIDEKQPGGWFGWYPVETNKSGLPKEKKGGQESDDGKGRFPFPVYWMPYMAQEREKEEPSKKENVFHPKLSLEPVKDSGEKPGGQFCSVVKDIPVKELKDNLTSTSKEDRRDSSIKDVTGSREMLNKNEPKTKSSSPPKSSKLPPICLRVDPLPRRKDTISPPEDKKKPDKVFNERKAPSTHAPREKPDHGTNKESKEGKGVTKAIKLVDANTYQEECTKSQTEEKHEKEGIPDECTKSSDTIMKVQSEDTGSARAGNGDVSSVKEEVKTPNKPKLSEADAAVIIQSAYRGFDIRRWEPVKKLKVIAEVRERIAEVRELIRGMESSCDIQGDSKQRNIIAETIMSLLLKLDTIQGLHPSIRDVRKSVVKELVCLQEKLDALVTEKLKALQEQESVAAKHETQSDLIQPCQNQFDGIRDQASEILEENLVTRKLDKEASESCMPEGSGSAIEPTKLKEDEQSIQSSESSPIKEDGRDSVLGRDTYCSVDEVVDSLSVKEKTESEQPLEVAGDLLMLSDAERGEPDQAKKPGEGMLEAYISRSNHDTNERERDCTEYYQLGVSRGEINTKLDATEITNSVDGLSEEKCTPCEEFGPTKQVDTGCKPDECSAQSPKSVISDLYKSSEVADKNDNPIAEEASNVENANSITSQADLSVVEEASDELPMKEYEAEEKPSKESADIAEKVAGEIPPDINVSDQSSVEQREEAEYEQVFDEEKQTVQNQEHFLLEKNCKLECVEGESANEEEPTPKTKITSVAAANANQGEPINRDDEKLIEENEKLRDLVEKLVKSGQEQLRVISNLSGRVKHLERNLSKKRKLKVKPHKAEKTSFFERLD